MSISLQNPSRRLLVYEPRVEGHHPGWLRFITEDLLSASYTLTLAVDLRQRSRRILEEHLGELLKEVHLLPAVEESGRPRGGSTAQSLLLGLEESSATRAFMCAFDELASRAFRRAALGMPPPPSLHGRVGGIFHRPRFTTTPLWSPNRWLKQAGFRRLMNDGWIRPLLMVDEYLAEGFKASFPRAPVFFLPDPCPADFAGDRDSARSKLGVPPGSKVFLFFGVGAKRKGLHLAVDAMQRLSDRDAFLLVAGQQQPTPPVQRGLEHLEQQRRARVLNRYVSNEEEKWCFQASDCALLPYLNHFGTSGVLSRAMAVGIPVIVSDEQLLGRLVRDNDLGWLFRSGDASDLAACLTTALQMDRPRREQFARNAADYARRYSRTAYRTALLASLETP
jgi:glycosyltransferase involved in cell wall biosynthesis